MINRQYLEHNLIMLGRMRHALIQTFASDPDDWCMTRKDKAEGIRQITHKMNRINRLLDYPEIELEPEFA